MIIKKLLLIIFISALLNISLSAQNHTSVHLDSRIYYILEQAELRGLCSPLSGIRPYTENIITAAINEILENENARRLSETEKAILNNYLDLYSKDKTGFDFKNGKWSGKTTIGNDFLLSLNAGLNADIELSGALYSFNDGYYLGNEAWLGFYGNGDIGKYFSWEIKAEAGLIKTPRVLLGEYNTYYEGFINEYPFENKQLLAYSQPLTYLPYTYKKRWDGSVHYLDSLDSFDSWPNTMSVGYNLLSELSSSVLNDKLFFRIGRLNHDWGSTSFGSSLALNRMSRPFIGIEGEFRPLSWLSAASLTGLLEFFNAEGEKKSAMTFQNAYSITMVRLNIKNFVFFEIGEMVVWPKRFELGYMFPLVSSLIYKGNSGDFDNLGAVVNIKAQLPGVGNIWFSFFGDEARFQKDFHELDRIMIAWQTGINITLPVFSFSLLKFSYTKINPYTYTHTRVLVPWYGNNIAMEEAYVNNGVSLGYYMPPNSDEFLVSLKTMPLKSLTVHFQYQLMRHGADFGSSAVDGSSLLSELDPNGRDGSRLELRRFFLQDGAYQWNHIIKAGVEWKIPVIPVAFFLEAGMNYSYFTNIAEAANITGKAHQYFEIDTPEYPKFTGYIIKTGIKVFPK